MSKKKREKIFHLILKRTKKRGTRPGKKTDKLSKKTPNPENPKSVPKASLWMPTDPENDLGEQDKRLLLSLVAKVATRQIFKLHLYSFAG